MLKDILVCLEGSAGTERAAGTALDLARELGASLTGMAIVDEPDPQAAAAARAKADTWRRTFLDRCEKAGVLARGVEATGRPSHTILAELESRDLAVLGRDANFLFETDEKDSATRHVILHRARKPVLLVPPGPPAGDRRIVMIAYDGSSAANRAVESFAASGLALDRTVHVGTVDDDGEDAWETAQRALQMLKAAGITAMAQNVVSALSVPEALLELRTKLDAGLLVMGAYARTRVSELIWGSVTDDLIANAPVPIYLHH